MSSKIKLRHIWHEIYFKIASKKAVDFSLKCREVVQHIDLNQKPETLTYKFRFLLHLSFCQACKNYYDFSKFLKKIIIKKVMNQVTDTKNLNIKLINKFKKK